VAAQSRAQDAKNDAERTDAEKEAVKRAVETYLYAEEGDEKKSPLSEDAKIHGVDASRSRVRVTPLSKPSGKRPKGAKTLRSPQRIVSIDVVNDGASVKVATDFTPDDKTDAADSHFQFIWLLKVGGEWKVVGILMPSTTPRGAASR
jgi:hypothetical protein